MGNAKKECSSCGRGGDDLKICTGCRHVYYCNKECQIAHRTAHKKECKELATRREQYNTDPSIEYACAKCNSKAEVRYVTCPVPPWLNQSMCGKCCSYLGINPPPSAWMYQDIEVILANPKKNPFDCICAQCKNGECQYKCPDCDKVWYCNEDCMMAHRSRHETKCRLLQRSRNDVH